MKKVTLFLTQVIISLAFILCVLGYTVAISQAFVSPDQVLKVIRK